MNGILAFFVGAKKSKETECTCVQCQKQWYINDAQVLRYAGNVFASAGHALAGSNLLSAVHANYSNDPFQCPSCGSKKIKKRKVTFWIDKKGNYIE